MQRRAVARVVTCRAGNGEIVACLEHAAVRVEVRSLETVGNRAPDADFKRKLASVIAVYGRVEFRRIVRFAEHLAAQKLKRAVAVIRYAKARIGVDARQIQRPSQNGYSCKRVLLVTRHDATENGFAALLDVGRRIGTRAAPVKPSELKSRHRGGRAGRIEDEPAALFQNYTSGGIGIVYRATPPDADAVHAIGAKRAAVSDVERSALMGRIKYRRADKRISPVRSSESQRAVNIHLADAQDKLLSGDLASESAGSAVGIVVQIERLCLAVASNRLGPCRAITFVVQQCVCCRRGQSSSTPVGRITPVIVSCALLDPRRGGRWMRGEGDCCRKADEAGAFHCGSSLLCFAGLYGTGVAKSPSNESGISKTSSALLQSAQKA